MFGRKREGKDLSNILWKGEGRGEAEEGWGSLKKRMKETVGRVERDEGKGRKEGCGMGNAGN